MVNGTSWYTLQYLSECLVIAQDILCQSSGVRARSQSALEGQVVRGEGNGVSLIGASFISSNPQHSMGNVGKDQL